MFVDIRNFGKTVQARFPLRKLRGRGAMRAAVPPNLVTRFKPFEMRTYVAIRNALFIVFLLSLWLYKHRIDLIPDEIDAWLM
jgi:hypothetical protein